MKKKTIHLIVRWYCTEGYKEHLEKVSDKPTFEQKFGGSPSKVLNTMTDVGSQQQAKKVFTSRMFQIWGKWKDLLTK